MTEIKCGSTCVLIKCDSSLILAAWKLLYVIGTRTNNILDFVDF